MTVQEDNPSLKTSRWPASLHGGQVAILMAVLSAVGYGGMWFASVLLFDAPARAYGTQPPSEVRWWFAGAIAVVASAHLLGYAWQKGRTLNVIASLCLALWLPVVVGFWSGSRLPAALEAQIEWHKALPKNSFGEDYAESQKRRLAYDSVYLAYFELCLLSGAAGVVSLYFWFGGRAKKAEASP